MKSAWLVFICGRSSAFTIRARLRKRTTLSAAFREHAHVPQSSPKHYMGYRWSHNSFPVSNTTHSSSPLLSTLTKLPIPPP